MSRIVTPRSRDAAPGPKAPGAGVSAQNPSLPPPAVWRDETVVGTALTVVAVALTLLAPLPLAIVGAVAAVALAAWFPLPGLCAIVLSLPFYLLTRSVGRYEFSPTEILLLVNLVGGGLAGLKSWFFREESPLPVKKRRRGKSSAGVRRFLQSQVLGDPFVLTLLGLLLLAAVVSLTASVAIHESVQSLRVIIVEPMVFYVLALTRIHDRRGAIALALALVLAGVLISGVGLWQYATDERIITAEAGLRRIRGFYGSPNNLGLFLGRALPVAFALALWWRRGRPALVVATVIMAIALVLTFSIGAWIATGLSVLVVAALHGRKSLRVAGGIALVAVIGGALTAVEIPRIGSHFNLADGTTSIRLDVWQSAVRMLADHRVRGIGLDNFLIYYQNGYRLPSAWQDPALSHPHNIILDFWLSLGLPGPFILAGLIGRFVELVMAGWRASSPIERGLYAAVVGAMVDTILHGFIDNSFFLVDLAVLFWLMFAIVGVLHRLDSKQAS